MIPELAKRQKEKQITATSTLQKIIVDYFSFDIVNNIDDSLDALGVTFDEKMSVTKHLNSAVENVQKIIKSKGVYESNTDPQTLLAKIDFCLFTEGYDNVTVNSKDYQELFIKNGDKLFKRYEPEIIADMIKLGIVGYLRGPNGEPPKTIKISRSVDPGRISISKEL